jgi:hypothetical protein
VPPLVPPEPLVPAEPPVEAPPPLEPPEPMEPPLDPPVDAPTLPPVSAPLRLVEPVVVARSRVPVDTEVPVVLRSRVPVETETPVRVELTPRLSTATPPDRCTLVRRTDTLEGSSATCRVRLRTTTLRVGARLETYLFFFVTLLTVVGSSETETLRRRVTETRGSSVVRLWTETPSRRDSVLTPTPTRVRLVVPTLLSERLLAPMLLPEVEPEPELMPEFEPDPELMPVLLPEPEVELDPELGEVWA